MTALNPDDFVLYGPDANCTLAICPIEWSLYEYRPTRGGNIAFLCLFLLSILVHTALGFRWKSWFFVGCMVIGSAVEALGYVGRLLLYNNPWSFNGFMIQIVCITTAPVFYCAAIYTTIGRTVQNLDPSLSRIRPNLYYWIFIPCDLVSLVLQGVGGGMSSSSSGTSQPAIDTALAGLSFQVFTLFVFCILFADYLVRYFRSSGVTAAATTPARLKVFLGALGLATVLILVRCAYRVDELSKGYNGSDLITHQSLFIGLEGVVIIISVFVLCLGHPGFAFGEAGQRVVAKREDSESSGQMQEM